MDQPNNKKQEAKVARSKRKFILMAKQFPKRTTSKENKLLSYQSKGNYLFHLDRSLT